MLYVSRCCRIAFANLFGSWLDRRSTIVYNAAVAALAAAAIVVAVNHLVGKNLQLQLQLQLELQLQLVLGMTMDTFTLKLKASLLVVSDIDLSSLIVHTIGSQVEH